jgi:type IV secretory pathway VirB6-like protein
LGKQLISFVTGLVIVGIATIVLLQLFLRYIYDYEIKGDQVRVLLFRVVPVMTIAISNIREIKECPPIELWKPTFVLKFGNRLWGDCVLIRKNRGLLRSVVITPDNAHEFVEHVKEIEGKEQHTSGG